MLVKASMKSSIFCTEELSTALARLRVVPEDAPSRAPLFCYAAKASAVHARAMGEPMNGYCRRDASSLQGLLVSRGISDVRLLVTERAIWRFHGGQIADRTLRRNRDRLP